MQSTGFLLCFRSCDRLGNDEDRPCCVTAGRYYACSVTTDDITHEAIQYTITDDNGLPINTTWDNIKDNLSLVLYLITDKKAIRALATQREGLKAFSRDRDGNPTFYDIRPLELNKLVGDCSFATISRRKERTTGFGLMLCYTDVKSNTVSRTSELYINAYVPTVLRYAERHSWTIYNEEQEPACPEALFTCTKTIFEGGDVLFEEGRLYPVERSGPVGDGATYRLRMSASGEMFRITKEGLETYFRRVGQILPNRGVVMSILHKSSITVQSFTSGRIVHSELSSDLVRDIVSCADKAYLISDTSYTNGAFLVCCENSAHSMFDFTLIGGAEDRETAERAAACNAFLPARSRLFEFDDVPVHTVRSEPRNAMKRYLTGQNRRAKEAYL